MRDEQQRRGKGPSLKQISSSLQNGLERDGFYSIGTICDQASLWILKIVSEYYYYYSLPHLHVLLRVSTQKKRNQIQHTNNAPSLSTCS
jgi:hypothetical protein